MKKIFLFLSAFLLINSFVFAQAPQGINYQGVARNSQGAALSMQNLNVRFTILQGTTPVYAETHALTTDTFGLYNAVIGQGTPATGIFSTINWSLGSYSAKVDIDAGTGYNTVGTVVLQSVPYALYAATSGNSSNGTVTSITAGGGLTSTPNPITTSGTIDLPTFAGVAGSYGSTTTIPTFTVDNYGRITSVNSVAIVPGGVSSVATTTPVINTGTSTAPIIGMTQAGIGSDGYLSSSDWNSFNGKVSSISTSGGGITSTSTGSAYTLTVNNAAPQWNANALQTTPVSSLTPTNGDFLRFNGTNWIPGPGGLPVGSAGSILFNPTGTSWVPTIPSNISSNGTGIGIGTNAPAALLDIVNTNTTNVASISMNHNGPGYGIHIVNTYTNNGSPMLDIFHQDMGPATYISGQNTGNNADIVYVETKGGGNAIKGYTDATGNAIMGYYHGTSAGSSAILGMSDNTGGSAGKFQINNATNGSPALSVSTTGTGYSGQFSGGSGVQMDKLQVQTNLNIPLNANPNYVLTSDASGNATWQPPSGGGVSAVNATAPLTSSGGSSPIIGLSPSGVTTGSYGSANQIPSVTVDTYGRITSVTTNSIGGTLSGGTVNYVPKWSSATGLSSTSLIFDNGTAVGINNASPVSPLDVASAGNSPTIKSVNSGSIASAGAFLNTATTNTASALTVVTSGTGSALNASNNGTSGSAGSFNNSGGSNSSPALIASTTNATSFSGKFTGGAGLQTDKIEITSGAQPNAVLISSNGLGDAIWSSPINFSASGGSTSALSGSNTTVVFGTTDYVNPAGSFSGGIFTAPVNGVYHFDAGVTLNVSTPLSGAQDFRMQIQLGGGTYREAVVHLPNGYTGPVQNQISLDMQLSSGSQVSISIYQVSGQTIGLIASPNWSYFTGHIVR